MMNRATRVLCAVLTGLLASTSIAVAPVRAEGKCYLFIPEATPPAGQHWAESVEPETNRRCWILRKIDAPSQAKASIPVPVARAAVRKPPASPPRPTEQTAISAQPARAQPPAQPPANNNGNNPAAAAPMPQQAAQDSPNAAPPAAELQLLAPRIPDAGLLLLSRAQPLAAAASPTQETTQETTRETTRETGQEAGQESKEENRQETKQETSEQTSVEASQAPPAESTESTEEPGAIGKPNALQILLLALFCVPALYLAVVGTIRYTARARRRRHPYHYGSLHSAPAEPLLLPPPNRTRTRSRPERFDAAAGGATPPIPPASAS